MSQGVRVPQSHCVVSACDRRRLVSAPDSAVFVSDSDCPSPPSLPVTSAPSRIEVLKVQRVTKARAVVQVLSNPEPSTTLGVVRRAEWVIHVRSKRASERGAVCGGGDDDGEMSVKKSRAQVRREDRRATRDCL